MRWTIIRIPFQYYNPWALFLLDLEYLRLDSEAAQRFGNGVMGIDVSFLVRRWRSISYYQCPSSNKSDWTLRSIWLSGDNVAKPRINLPAFGDGEKTSHQNGDLGDGVDRWVYRMVMYGKHHIVASIGFAMRTVAKMGSVEEMAPLWKKFLAIF